MDHSTDQWRRRGVHGHEAQGQEMLPDDDGTVHFSGDNDTAENTSTDRDLTSKGTFLVFPLAQARQETKYQYKFPRWPPWVS